MQRLGLFRLWVDTFLQLKFNPPFLHGFAPGVAFVFSGAGSVPTSEPLQHNIFSLIPGLGFPFSPPGVAKTEFEMVRSIEGGVPTLVSFSDMEGNHHETRLQPCLEDPEERVASRSSSWEIKRDLV